MRIASAAYPIDWLSDWAAYEAKLTAWVEAADADLLVFPEYGSMELAALSGAEEAGDLSRSIDAVMALLPRVDALHTALAERYGVHILAASAPVREGERVVNRARLFTPKGHVAAQDKQIMTRFEREDWGIAAGGPLRVFETGVGRIGVLICYDSEFPLLARALVDAGAEIILCPSCTDSIAGFSRVRVGAMARALEGQCITVQSPTVGLAPWSPAVDENHGAAGIFGPPDDGFPDTGIFAQGAPDTPGWVRAAVDLDLVRQVRFNGRALNQRHWPEQTPRLGVETVPLA